MDTIIGFDIGGTKIAVVEGTHHGEILQKEIVSNQPQMPFENVFDQMCAAAQTLIESAHQMGRSPNTISVAIGGPLDIGRGLIHSPPNLPTWADVPLKKRLEDRLATCRCLLSTMATQARLQSLRTGLGDPFKI